MKYNSPSQSASGFIKSSNYRSESEGIKHSNTSYAKYGM